MRFTDARTLLVRAPWLAPLLLGVLLALGAMAGRYWQMIALLMMAMLFTMAWVMTVEVQRIAVLFMLVNPFLAVFTLIRPDEYNYLAYGSFLAFAAGVVTLLKRPSRHNTVLLFLGWFVASAIYSTVLIRPSPNYIFLVSPLAMLGMFAILSGTRDAVRSLFIRGLVLIAAIQAPLGIAQTLGDLPPFAVWGGQVFSEPRNYLALILPGVSSQVRMATGTFSHFNGLGSLLALVLPIALSSWLQKRTFQTGAIFVLIAGGLVCTFSRGALLGGLIGCIVVFSKYGMSLAKAARRTFLMLVIITLATLGFSAVQGYISTTNNFGSRLAAWQIALTSVLADPVTLLFGAGFSFFASGYLQEQSAISRLHSAPVQILTELGLMATAVFVIAFLPPLRQGLKSISTETIALAASCLAFLTHQIFDNALFGYPGMLFIGVFGCLLVSLSSDRVEASTGWLRKWA